MDQERLTAALTAPETPQEAEVWVEHVVRALGPRFAPDTGFGDYWLDQEIEEHLDAALLRARGLLEDRLNDLVYRSAEAFLSDLDLEFRAWARPVSQPPARLWLVERPSLDADPGVLDPRRGLALEDERGTWWIWEPATRRFYNDTPWLFTNFYYQAGAKTKEWVEVEFEGQLRFTPLSSAEALALIEGNQVGGAGEEHVADRRQREPALELEEALRQVKTTDG